MEYSQIAELLSTGKLNYRSYELYFMLGEYYRDKNINQAYLCYENAYFYCDDEDDLKVIQTCKENAAMHPDFCVRKTSIVIVSYNLSKQTEECLQSIRENNLASTYELIVVDNASIDRNIEWLKTQQDIKLIMNSENMGFPYACNQGIKLSEGENNIFILHNDTIVPPNAIYQLRMGLYENETIGATGSVTNYALNNQYINERHMSVEEYMSYAQSNNVPQLGVHEKKLWLMGVALMLKREALDSVGLFDTRFSPGNFEDCDLAIRLHHAGWKAILCRNSFIFHYGCGGGSNEDFWTSSRKSNKLYEKWNFNINYYSQARTDMIDLIIQDHEDTFTVLEIGCGCGTTMAKIEYQWPKAVVKGIELMEDIAKIGSNYLDIIQGNIESMELPYQAEEFDYIIMADVLEHLYDPEKLLKRLRSYLKKDGKILCSIPNIMHKSVIAPLLKGEFEYQDWGILDRTHLRFFTLSSMKNMFGRCGLSLCDLGGRTMPEIIDEKGNLKLLEIDKNDTASKQLHEVSQFIVSVQKSEA